jgi:hypothetical protein
MTPTKKGRRSRKKKLGLGSGLGTIIILVVGVFLAFTESQSFLGVGIAAVLVLLGSLLSLVGFAPFGIGSAVYYFLAYPWLVQNTVGIYGLMMPVTVFAIGVMTAALSILWTVMSSAIILFFTR